jgi:hypothetical protein
MITLTCPACAAKVKAPDRAAGRLAPCPRCHKRFRVSTAPPLSPSAVWAAAVNPDPPAVSVRRRRKPIATALIVAAILTAGLTTTAVLIYQQARIEELRKAEAVYTERQRAAERVMFALQREKAREQSEHKEREAAATAAARAKAEAERRRRERAAREESERRERAERLRREFDMLPMAEQLKINSARKLLEAVPIGRLPRHPEDWEVTTMGRYWEHFDAPQADIRAAVMRLGVMRGAGDQINNLRLDDPERKDQVRLAFGMAEEGWECPHALIISRLVRENGVASLHDQLKSFIRLHPSMFPGL